MKSTSTPKGFTLIELLVVIAIIGILSSVVLASLSLARMKGADASIRSNLHTIQNQSEIYYGNNNNTYGPALSGQASAVSAVPTVGSSLFITDPTINAALKAAMAQSGQGYWAVGTNGATYAVEFQLKSSGNWWCIDSSGAPSCIATANSGSLGGGAAAVAGCSTTVLPLSSCK